MKTLSWKPILSNLSEAYGELTGLYCRLHFMAFGEMPDNWQDDGSYKAWLEKREKEHPFTEMTLYVSLDHAYHHLNWAWNIRRTPEERIWHFTQESARKWGKFPKTKVFSDLWSPTTSPKIIKDKPRFRKISLTPMRVRIQMALWKLGILCHRVENEAKINSSIGNTRLKRLNEDVDSQPLSEKEFANRMHRIYAEMNMAWNSRKDKTFVIKSYAIHRRRCFPYIFYR